MSKRYTPKVKNGDEMEKGKNTKNITNRSGTGIYEVSKTLSEVRGEIFTREDFDLKHELLKMNGLCEYCEKHDASTQDHYRPLVKDSHPTENCNDEWNMIPCCKDCNSSKGNTDIFIWIAGDSEKNPFRKLSAEEKQKVLGKWKAYDEAFEERHYVKVFPEEEVRELKKKHDDMLRQMQEDTNRLRERTVYRRKIDRGSGVVLEEKSEKVVGNEKTTPPVSVNTTPATVEHPLSSYMY